MTNLDQVSQLIVCHANQVDVAEVEQLTTLDPSRAVELPTADQTVEPGAGAAQKWLATSDGEFIHPTDLESMPQGIIIKDVEARRPKRRLICARNTRPRRFEGFGELVICLHLQSIGQAAAQVDLHGVVA